MNPAGSDARRRVQFFAVALGLVVSLPAVWALPDGYWPESVGYALVQLGCSAVAAAIVVVAVRAYAEDGNYRLLCMGLAFLCFGVLDMLHSLAAPGDPELPLGSDENISLWFNQASRLIGSVLLLVSVALPARLGIRASHHGRSAGWYLLVTAGLLLAIMFVVPGTARSSPSLWDPTGGVAVLRRTLELAVIAIQVTVAVNYVRLWEQRRQDVLLLFALGMVGLALAGAALIAQHNFYDIVFWLAYAYKLFAYLCFGAGVWTLIRPPAESEAAAES